MPKPPALVDRRNTNISISVLNSSIRCILQNTRHHASGLGKRSTLDPELNTEVGMIFWERGQQHCTAAPKYRCHTAGKRVPTVLCSNQKNILSDRWIARSESRLRKRFPMITESVGGQWKTGTHETNGEAGNEFCFKTIFCTNYKCKVRNRHQLYMGTNTPARMTVF